MSFRTFLVLFCILSYLKTLQCLHYVLVSGKAYHHVSYLEELPQGFAIWNDKLYSYLGKNALFTIYQIYGESVISCTFTFKGFIYLLASILRINWITKSDVQNSTWIKKTIHLTVFTRSYIRVQSAYKIASYLKKKHF